MSKENLGERMARVEAIILEMKEGIARIEAKVDDGRRNDDEEFKQIRKALTKDFDEFEKKLEKRFSPLWVRDLVLWAGGLFSAVITAILIKLFGKF